MLGCRTASCGFLVSFSMFEVGMGVELFEPSLDIWSVLELERVCESSVAMETFSFLRDVAASEDSNGGDSLVACCSTKSRIRDRDS